MDAAESRDLSRPVPLSKGKLLLVEGRDDAELFSALLTHLGLTTEIEIRQYLGKTEFRNYVGVLTRVRGFRDVTSIGIIRDADDNASGAFESIKNSLIYGGLPSPNEPLSPSTGFPTTAIVIMPPGEAEGELEDLLLSSVNTDVAIPCVEGYFNCLGPLRLNLPRKLSKARLHTFLASRENPNLLIGQAARAGYFPWDATPFVPVIEFLRTL